MADMLPLQMSSGDLIADRRAGYAEALCAEDPAAAADLYVQALALVPGWAAGWFRLGEIRAQADLPGAQESFAQALALDPQDRLGAALRLDLLRGAAPEARMPSAFVETLFDQYAGAFDSALVERLGYRAPQVLAARLPGPLGRVLDLGCGTGLMGAALAPRAQDLEGWDLSAEMLRAAQAKGLYTRLAKRDLGDLPPPLPHWDTITACDVFAYLGALEGIIAWAGAALAPGGRFGFTVEAHDGAEPLVLRPSRRFAHRRDYLEGLLDGAGLRAAITREPLRMDGGVPVEGWVVVAEAAA